MDKLIYSKYSNDRNVSYQIRTAIYENEAGGRYVLKTAMSKDSVAHIEKMCKVCVDLKEQFKDTLFEPNNGERDGDSIRLEYVEGRTLDSILRGLLQVGNIDGFKALISKYREEIKKAAVTEFVPSDGYFELFGKDADTESGQKALKVSDIDMIFQNVVVVDGRWVLLDYEWSFYASVPVDFVLYRTAHYFEAWARQLLEHSKIDIYDELNIDSEKKDRYYDMEQFFQKYILGDYAPLRIIYHKNRQNTTRYIGEILKEKNIERLRKRIQIFEDYGKGFERLDNFIEPIESDDETKTYKFPVKKGLKLFRLDPAETSCFVYLSSVIARTADGDEKKLRWRTNGKPLGRKHIIFDTSDPQIWLNNIPENCISIVFEMGISHIGDSTGEWGKWLFKRFEEFKKEISEDVRTIDELNEKIAEMNAELSAKNALIDEMQNSTSWKLTEPLRKAGRTIKRKS